MELVQEEQEHFIDQMASLLDMEVLNWIKLVLT